ncbi:hypothetical protein L6164_029551 [Bauhinia variegata]|uniref:Uncharacterized protein n=1 Tax=Bauhinia variegata TaxID=167791 RepID=A0ACB9L9N4_BAUVA|nr:hypothetical protein L6164_029551 [Bauhinia variegata]
MLATLPPPPPPPLSPSPPRKQTKPVPLDQIIISKQSKNQCSLDPEAPNSVTRKESRPPTLRGPKLQRTNPVVWCTAVLCLIFSLILILFGVATLIIFLTFKPRNPLFDIPNASLNAVYFDSPQYFNGDFILLANFSNPNRKMDVKFESSDIELFFLDRLISSQAIQPFTQRRRENRLQTVHFISSLVFLPQDVGVNLQRQVQSNKVEYNVRATFRVRVYLGLFHLRYWLHSRCQLEITGPPTGVLVARRCITKR